MDMIAEISNTNKETIKALLMHIVERAEKLGSTRVITIIKEIQQKEMMITS